MKNFHGDEIFLASSLFWNLFIWLVNLLRTMFVSQSLIFLKEIIFIDTYNGYTLTST